MHAEFRGTGVSRLRYTSYQGALISSFALVCTRHLFLTVGQEETVTWRNSGFMFSLYSLKRLRNWGSLELKLRNLLRNWKKTLFLLHPDSRARYYSTPLNTEKNKCAHTHTTEAQKYHFPPSSLQCTFTLTHTHTHCLPRRSTGLGQHNCLPFHPPCKSPVQNVAKQHSTGKWTCEITACVGTSISILMPQILSATNTLSRTAPLTLKKWISELQYIATIKAPHSQISQLLALFKSHKYFLSSPRWQRLTWTIHLRISEISDCEKSNGMQSNDTLPPPGSGLVSVSTCF
jgi:hypothetical protein